MNHLRSVKGSQDFLVDLELEAWRERPVSTLLERVKRLCGLEKENRLTNAKGPYTPEEVAIVDSFIEGFLQVFHISRTNSYFQIGEENEETRVSSILIRRI